MGVELWPFCCFLSVRLLQFKRFCDIHTNHVARDSHDMTSGRVERYNVIKMCGEGGEPFFSVVQTVMCEKRNSWVSIRFGNKEIAES